MQRFSGLEYIKIDIANCYGMDKLTWEDRIGWVDHHMNHGSLVDQVDTADEPVLMAKALRAMTDAIAGRPTGFIMGLDATASGIQIMAALMGCPVTAANVNLLDTGSREDVYTRIPDVMNMPEVTRDMAKKPIMTTFYGSLAQPKDVFGEDTEALRTFYKALGQELPGAMECMQDMQECWNPEAYEYSWELPDGHTAVMKVLQTVDKKVEVDELNHSTFTYRFQVNEPMPFGVALAANIVHSIDGYVVREMYRRAAKQGFEIVTIHDSFWASPNHMNEVRDNYRQILADIADANILESILQQVSSNPEGKLKRFSSDLGNEIRKAEYALS